MNADLNYIKTLIAEQSPELEEIDRWIRVFKSKNWFNPKAYGDLSIDFLNEHLGVLVSYLENNILNLPHIYKALNLNEEQVLTSINAILRENNSRFKSSHCYDLNIYQAWLSLNNSPMNADAFIRFNNSTSSLIRSDYPAELIINARDFVRDQEDSDKLKVYILKTLENELDFELIKEKYSKSFGASAKTINNWIDIDHLSTSEYKSRLNKLKSTVAATEFSFPASKHIKADHVIYKNKDLPSLIYLMQNGVIPIRSSIENYFTANPERLIDNTTVLTLKEFLMDTYIPSEKMEFSNEYKIFFKNKMLQFAEDRYKQGDKKGMPNEIDMLAIHNTLGMNTSLFENKIIEQTQHLSRNIEFNPKSDFFKNLSESIKSAYLNVDFNIDPELRNLKELDSNDKIELLKTQAWFSKSLNDVKDKISTDTMALYLAAIDKKDPLWPSLFGKVLRSIQTNTSRSRKYIKLIKDAGGPAQASVSRDFDEVSAFVYAMTGDDSKALRKVADTMEINIFKEEYCFLVVEHVRKLLNPNADKELKLPSIDFEV